MIPCDGIRLFAETSAFVTPNIAYFLPKNISPRQVVSCVGRADAYTHWVDKQRRRGSGGGGGDGGAASPAFQRSRRHPTSFVPALAYDAQAQYARPPHASTTTTKTHVPFESPGAEIAHGYGYAVDANGDALDVDVQVESAARRGGAAGEAEEWCEIEKVVMDGETRMVTCYFGTLPLL
jgi:hypothetical protein